MLPPRLKKRREFLRASRAGQHASQPSLVVQATRRSAADGDAPAAAGPRVGFTVSKRVGNSVKRNRAKRRLREAAARVLAGVGRPDTDYVLVGRTATVDAPFAALLADLHAAVSKVNRRLERPPVRSQRRGRGRADAPSKDPAAAAPATTASQPDPLPPQG